MNAPETLDCGHMSTPSELTAGYGTGTDGKRYCYQCCARRDREDMIRTGKATLYLLRSRDVVFRGMRH